MPSLANRVFVRARLGGEVDEAACAFRGLDWYAAHGIRLITGAPATQIDRENGLVIVGGAGDATDLDADQVVDRLLELVAAAGAARAGA